MPRAILERAEIVRRSRELRVSRRKRRIYALVTLPLILFITLVALAHWGRFQLDEIRIEGAQTVVEDEIKSTVLAALVGRHIGLFPRQNIFLLPRRTIQARLAQAYPVLSQIDLRRIGRGLVITVDERVAEYLWCGSGEEAPCLFLDRAGFAFDQAPQFSGHPFFEIVSRSSLPTLGTSPLAPDEFAHFVSLVRDLSQVLGDSVIASVPTRVYLEEAGELSFQMGETRVMTTRLADPEQTMLNLRTAIGAEPFLIEYQKNIAAGQILEYLDLRVGGKMFYKFGT